MHKILTRLAFPLLAGAMLAGCMATGDGLGPSAGKGVNPEAPIVPLIEVAERRAEIAALPAHERGRWCLISFAEPSFERTATITGPIEYQNSNAQSAGNALFGLVESYYAGLDTSRNIRNALEEAARISAYTDIAPYEPPEFPGYNVMNEPIYQVGNFMVPLAHAYLILKHEYPEETALLADVRQWGNRLFRLTSNANDDFVGPHRGIDRRAHIAQGWASWGNVAENRAALNSAYRYYIHAMASVGQGGVDIVWFDVPATGGTRLSFVNATLQSALVAAHALHRSGARDVYSVAPGGGTLVEGIAWLWNEIEDKRPTELLTDTRNAGSKSVAWAELFVHEFPNHPAAKRMNEWLASKRALHVNMGGGPTTCLYRHVPAQT